MIKDTIGYAILKDEDSLEVIINEIRLNNGKEVTVYCCKTIRHSFETQMSIHGKFEIHPNSEEYRILLSEGTYCYFGPEDIIKIGVRTDGEFKDGSKTVIEIKI